LAVADASGVEVFLNNGKGGFWRPKPVVAGLEPTGLTVADVNGDGTPDLVVSNRFGDVLVLYGRGDGSFLPADPVAQPGAPAGRPGGAVGGAVKRGDLNPRRAGEEPRRDDARRGPERAGRRVLRATRAQRGGPGRPRRRRHPRPDRRQQRQQQPAGEARPPRR